MRAGGSDVENARRREEILTCLAFSTAVLTCVPPHLCTASPRLPVRHYFVHSENGAVGIYTAVALPACMRNMQGMTHRASHHGTLQACAPAGCAPTYIPTDRDQCVGSARVGSARQAGRDQCVGSARQAGSVATTL